MRQILPPIVCEKNTELRDIQYSGLAFLVRDSNPVSFDSKAWVYNDCDL